MAYKGDISSTSSSTENTNYDTICMAFCSKKQSNYLQISVTKILEIKLNLPKQHFFALLNQHFDCQQGRADGHLTIIQEQE